MWKVFLYRFLKLPCDFSCFTGTIASDAAASAVACAGGVADGGPTNKRRLELELRLLTILVL